MAVSVWRSPSTPSTSPIPDIFPNTSIRENRNHLRRTLGRAPSATDDRRLRWQRSRGCQVDDRAELALLRSRPAPNTSWTPAERALAHRSPPAAQPRRLGSGRPNRAAATEPEPGSPSSRPTAGLGPETATADPGKSMAIRRWPETNFAGRVHDAYGRLPLAGTQLSRRPQRLSSAPVTTPHPWLARGKS